MSSWNKTFSTVGTLVTEINSGIDIWCSYGKIESVEIVNREPDLEGSVILYAQTVGNRIRNTERFALKTAQLLALDFSTVLPGLSVYLSESTSHSLGGWDVLSDLNQELYNTTGNALFANGNLIPAWPITTTPPFVADIYVEESTGSQILSGGVLEFPTVYLSENQLKTITIKNRGPQVLRLTNTPKVILSGINSSDYIIGQPTVSSLLEEESTSFTVDFIPSVTGVSLAQLVIPNNDPEEGGFVINVSGLAGAKRSGEIDLLYSEANIENNLIEFFARPVGQTATQHLVFKNDGNETLTLKKVSISSDWSTVLDEAEIEPGDTLNFTIDFTPGTNGELTGSLVVSGTLNSETEFNKSYNLYGYGII